MSQPTWELPKKIAKGDPQHHPVYEHTGKDAARLVQAFIHTPEHIPPLVKGRKCKHDDPKVPKPLGYCFACEFHEPTQQYLHAVEISLVDEEDRVLARTSLIGKAPDEETVLHVEDRAYVHPGDKVYARFAHRGDGRDVPAGFKFRLVFA